LRWRRGKRRRTRGKPLLPPARRRKNGPKRRAKSRAGPLYIAAQKGDTAVTEQLIAARCNVIFRKRWEHPLGHESVAKQLLAARRNIDLRTVEMEGGRTALHLAKQQGHAGIAMIRNTKRQREEEWRQRKEEENRPTEEEERRQKEIRRQREEANLRKEEEERQKEEADFCRVWR
jgi:hypothetical protein